MGSIMLQIIFCVFILSKAFSSEVKAKGDASVAFGQDAFFSCFLSAAEKASQITWQRKYKNNSIQDLATYSKMYGENVMEPKVVFKEALLNSSSIIVRNVSLEDEACYVCTFHVYPIGSIWKPTCLTVHGITSVHTEKLQDPLRENVGENVLLRCLATGKPAPSITWSGDLVADDSGDTKSIQNKNGTTTVMRNITIVDLGKGGHVDCVVTSPGLSGNVTARVDLPKVQQESGPDHKHQLFVPLFIVLTILVVAGVIIFINAKSNKGCVRQLCVNGRNWIVQRHSRYPIDTDEDPKSDLERDATMSSSGKLPPALEPV